MSYDTEPHEEPQPQPPEGLKSERVQREATPEAPTQTGKTAETGTETSLKSERVQREAQGDEP